MAYKETHKSIRISSDLLEQVAILAKKENRRTPQQVEFLLRKALKRVTTRIRNY